MSISTICIRFPLIPLESGPNYAASASRFPVNAPSVDEKGTSSVHRSSPHYSI